MSHAKAANVAHKGSHGAMAKADRQAASLMCNLPRLVPFAHSCECPRLAARLVQAVQLHGAWGKGSSQAGMLLEAQC